MEASEDAISAALIVSSPGSSPGSEELVVETSDGVEVTMTLAPLDPGWAVEGAQWCAPDTE
jgi:hypothetical protein